MTISKFLIRTFALGIVVALIAVAICVVSNSILKSIDFRISSEKNILVIGDSHTECGIDDRILTRSFNIAKSGTPYLFSGCVLRQFIQANPQIDTVILSFHPGALTVNYTEDLYSDKSISYRLPSHISMLTSDELDLLGVSQIDIWITHLRAMRYAAKSLTTKPDYQVLKLGGYLHIELNEVQKEIEYRKATSTRFELFTARTVQLNALNAIAEFCADNGVELILMDTPKHEAERTLTRTMFYRDIVPNLPFKHTYVDYSNFELDDTDYRDLCHLNYRGAGKFSRYLQQNGIVNTPPSPEPPATSSHSPRAGKSRKIAKL